MQNQTLTVGAIAGFCGRGRVCVFFQLLLLFLSLCYQFALIREFYALQAATISGSSIFHAGPSFRYAADNLSPTVDKLHLASDMTLPTAEQYDDFFYTYHSRIYIICTSRYLCWHVCAFEIRFRHVH